MFLPELFHIGEVGAFQFIVFLTYQAKQFAQFKHKGYWGAIGYGILFYRPADLEEQHALRSIKRDVHRSFFYTLAFFEGLHPL